MSIARTGLIRVPDAVVQLVRRLEDSGFDAWTVGGGVRDSLLGAPGTDWDLATQAGPDDMRRIFRRTAPIGVEHGTVGVFGPDGKLYEVTTYRRDVSTDGRRAVVAFATSLRDDLARRDFTVNAIAWHPIKKTLYDPFRGQADLEARILRAVGDPAERFREDYLRVLRGLRFAGTLGLKPTDETWHALVEAVPGTCALSRERVRDELMRVLSSKAPSASLSLYAGSGLFANVFPEASSPLSPETLRIVDEISPRRPLLRLVALFRRDARMKRPDAADKFLKRLRFSNADRRFARAILALLRDAPPLERLVGEDYLRRRWTAGAGKELLRNLLRFWLAVNRAERRRRADRAGKTLARLIRKVRRDRDRGVPLDLPGLAIGGDELLGLGWRPGPSIGRALKALLEDVWEDPSRNTQHRLLGRAIRLRRGKV